MKVNTGDSDICCNHFSYLLVLRLNKAIFPHSHKIGKTSDDLPRLSGPGAALVIHDIGALTSGRAWW